MSVNCPFENRLWIGVWIGSVYESVHALDLVFLKQLMGPVGGIPNTPPSPSPLPG